MNKPSKIKVGITGNIGCGKSTVSQLLTGYPGITLIDTDSLAKQIAAQPEHADTIAKLVGFSVNFSKSEDRKRLAEVLFSQPSILDAYQKFIHPLVWKEVDEQFNRLSSGIMVIESAILFEVQSEHHYDKVIMVGCDEAVQIDRLCNGNRKMQESDVRARMSLQIPQSVKKAKADFIIDNSGNAQELKDSVEKLYHQLNQLIMKKGKTKALFVFSADPPTLGHEWLIAEALKRYDELAVAITYNPAKKGDFTIEQRCEMVRALVPGHVPVTTFSEMYSVDYAESIGATYFIRGIRNAVDNDYEQMMAGLNREINPSVETVFIESPVELRDVSSTAVRLIVGQLGFECKGWEALTATKVSPVVLVHIIAKHHDLFRNLQSIGAQGDPISFWTKVLMPYLNKNRHYHTIKHIGAMISDFKKVRHLCTDPIVVEYAIWLHDWYYETMNASHDNEERSAAFAIELAKELGLSDEFCKKVEQLILATKHNQTVTDNDEQLLIDLDLAVFGALPRVFDEYETNVRKEWDFVPDDDFNKARHGIMQEFSKQRIFATDYFYEKYESQAHANLKRSLDRWS